jgi:hypothetical protein
MTRLPTLAVLLCLITAATLAYGISIQADGGAPLSHWTFQLPLMLAVPVYLAACWRVLRPGTTASLWFILGVGLVLRLAVWPTHPMLSSDVFRYVWDGVVQNHGINPYLHIPADPALAALRDDAIYPNINRASYAPTIYPPAAQMLFAVVAAISPTVLAMKAAMMLLDGVTIAALLVMLRRTGRPLAHVLIYAWNPLGVWEFAGNGHVDAAAVALLTLAMLLCVSQRSIGGGIALAGAVLIKFIPAVAAPALWRRGSPGWRLMASFLVAITIAYGVYIMWDGTGARVLGFLGAYGGEEGLSNGSGIWALAGVGLLTTLPGWAASLYLALAAIGLAGLGCWIAFGPAARVPLGIERVAGNVALLGTAMMLLISPHYPWYFVWLAAPAVLAPNAATIWLSSAAILLYENPLPDHFIWQALLFAPAIVLIWHDRRVAKPIVSFPALQGTL